MAMECFICLEVMVMSSAYDDILMSALLGVGMSCMKRLKRVGDKTEPCGTPSRNGCILDGVSLKFT